MIIDVKLNLSESQVKKLIEWSEQSKKEVSVVVEEIVALRILNNAKSLSHNTSLTKRGGGNVIAPNARAGISKTPVTKPPKMTASDYKSELKYLDSRLELYKTQGRKQPFQLIDVYGETVYRDIKHRECFGKVAKEYLLSRGDVRVSDRPSKRACYEIVYE